MIKVEIIKWKKSTLWLNLIFITCFIASITIILVDNESTKALGFFLLLLSTVSILIVKFMDKSKSIGNISFYEDKFIIEMDGFIKELDYRLIDKLDFNNYNGKQFFSLKSIYPYHDGLNNYLYIKSEKGIEKMEIKIDSEQKYKSLTTHFNLLQGGIETEEWKIRPL